MAWSTTLKLFFCLGTWLNILGECVCGHYEILNDDGVCECDTTDDMFITTETGCVKCYGLGALLNDDGICTCEGVVDAQFDAFEIGKCVCKPGVFTVSTHCI